MRVVKDSDDINASESISLSAQGRAEGWYEAAELHLTVPPHLKFLPLHPIIIYVPIYIYIIPYQPLFPCRPT